jgi:uncharacterized protein YjdB
MKKLSLVFLLLCLSLAGYSQTAASYGFTATNGTFTSIAGVGTEATGVESDDVTQTSIPIGFTFNFCGTGYSQLSACSNGWLSLANSSSSSNTNDASVSWGMSAVSGGQGMLMSFWDDLLLSSGGAYYLTTGSPGSQIFTFEWSGYAPWSSAASGIMNFQVKLYEATGVIEYIYQGGSYSGTTGTIGIANSTTDYQTLSNTSAAPISSSFSFVSGLSSSPADGQVYRYTPPAPCSGAIVAGTAHANLITACATDNVVVNLTGTTAALGLSYQWQYYDGSLGVWTNFAGATTNPATVNIATDATIRALVTCDASGYVDSSTSVDIAFSPVCFCTPSYTGTPATTYAMTNFMVNSYGGYVFNDAGPTPVPASGYEDITDSVIAFQQGESYTGSISYGSYIYGMYDQIWIDFNDNGTFETSEMVTPLIGTGGGASSDAFTLSIPLTAATGSHRMRVRSVYTWYSLSMVDPCLPYDPTTTYYSYNTGVTRDYYANIMAAPTCSGTPEAGSATASTGYGCSTLPFTLTATGYTVATGLSLQWRTSTDGSTWTDIPGATNTSYDITPTSAAYYQFAVTCTASGQMDTTNAVYVNFFGACTCVPTYWSTPYSGAYDGISHFGLTGYGGTSIDDYGATPIPSSGYEDRTSLSIDLQQGNSYSGTLDLLGYGYNSYQSQIWIDYNDDGNFDISEEATGIINWGSYSTSGSYTLNVPLTATVGTHRMRVRYTSLGWGSSLSTDMDACNSYDLSNTYYNGMAWDYIVNIIAAPACSGTPDAGVAATSTYYACPSSSFTLSASGYTVATGLEYQWYTSSTGATGSWTAIPGATDITYNATTTGEAYYQLMLTCTASAESDTTNALHVGFFSTCTCPVSYYYSPATTSDYGLSNVQLTGYSGSTINDAGPATWPTSGYQDRTFISVDLQQGGTYNGTLTYNTGFYPNYESQVWIDFNDDGTFDATEQVTPVISSGYGSYASSDPYALTIPITANTGAHRMRVRYAYIGWTSSNSSAMDPCNSYDAINYYYYGTTRDYIANIIAIPDCSGAPVMGSTVATPSSGGETTMFTITAPGVVLAAGINYQWQSSPDGSTWTNIPGATSMSYSFIGISAETFYQLVGTCTLSGGTTAASTPVDVTYVPASPCTSDASSWTVMTYGGPAPDYGVDAFNVNGFSGTSITDAGIQAVADASTGYLDRTTTLAPVTFEQGLSYASSATWSPVSYHQELQVWIDFNDNGLFEVSEEVSPVSGFDNSSTPNPTLFNISIPASATLGLHKMRLRGIWEENSTSLNDTPAHLDPCGHNFFGTAPNYWSGVVVDYQVNIVPPCLITASATTGGAVCPGSSAQLIGTTTAPTYSWSGPGGYSSTSLSPYVASTPGTYTFTATDGACTLNYTAAVSNLPAPATPVVTPSVATICNGSTLTISATVAPMLRDLIPVQDFEVGVPVDPAISVDGWNTTSPSYYYITQESSGSHPAASPESGGYMAVFHSWSYGSLSGPTALISPNVDMTSITGGQISFWVYRDAVSYPASWGYTSEGWTVLMNTSNDLSTATTLGFVPRAYDASPSGDVTGEYYPSSGGWYQYTVNIPASYTGSSNYVFFQATTQYGDDCYLDNIHVTGLAPLAPPTWTPDTYLYSDVAATSSYTSGTPASTVYMHPVVSATTTQPYIVTATDGTCSTADTINITVNYVSPVVAGGSTTICAGNSLSLTNADAGGTWSLSNNTVANITTGGVVTGLASGVDTAYYTVGGCSSYIVINVSTVAPTISGTMALCTGGLTTTLTATGGAGTWSGGSASVATVDAGGMVTSTGVGSTIITYTLASGCSDTALFSVQAPPAAITGTASVCYAGGQTTLSDATAGGTWSISSGGVATITSGGVVTGLTGGSATVTYTTLPNCYATQSLTLNAYPSPITGASTVCTGFSTSLSALPGSGTWSTSVGGPATVDASGNVTGVSAGNATITYTGSNGCAVTTVVTVNSSPSAITGIASVCYVGGQTTLSSSPLGGTWSSSAGFVATVTSGGVVTALSGGAATITYTSPVNSCYATRTLTLNPNPNPIGGVGAVCAGGGTITLTESSGSGTWTSGATSIATVNSSGMVTGVSAGNAPITFTDGNGCSATATVTVNALPATITGTTTICNLASTTLADVSLPGTWSTTTPTITTVNASGMVTGLSAGIGTIVFTQTSTGCSRSVNVTVNGLPTSITLGSTSICAGTTTTATGLPASGTWSTSPSTVATVSGAGVVGGVGAGTANITYTNGSGCYITTTLAVNPSFVPSVAINATPGTTLCDGTTASYFATITNGGSSPTYAWTVNGTPVSTISSYSYTPVNGDIVGLTITSSLACAIPTTASAAVTMTVDPIVYPSLNINGTHNDTSCAGSPVVINTFPSAASISPTYQWYVNGTPTATGSSYSYTATDGDVVVAVMTAGASCLSGSSTYTAADTIIMDVVPVITPEVALSSSTGAVSCAGNIVAYLATPTNGGDAPSYLWTVNGINVATGPGYFYTPNNGDVVVVTMTSSYLCVSPASDTAMMTMSVLTGASPLVVITTTLSGEAYSGITDTFTVNIVSGGGTAPTYQWFVNGIAVTGETGPTYITNMLSSGDVVTCHVTNGDPCGGVTISNAITTVAGVGVNQVTQAQGSIEMMPNPNNGSFVVKGNLGVAVSEDMTLEVTDMVGQVVYTGHTQAKSGAFSENVQLSGLLANGMYILNVRSQHMQKQFHFVLNQQ